MNHNLLMALLEINDSYLFASEKIYTVLTVVLLIWGGILLYLFRLDKRLNRLEKEQTHKSKSESSFPSI